jgi:hypothetical protein
VLHNVPRLADFAMGMDIPVDIWIKKEDIHPLNIPWVGYPPFKIRMEKEDNSIIIPIFKVEFA